MARTILTPDAAAVPVIDAPRRSDGRDGTRTDERRTPVDARPAGGAPPDRSFGFGHADDVLVVSRRSHVAHVGVWSVAKVAAVFWMCVAALFVGAVLMTWTYLSGAGAVENVESFVADLTGFEDFQIVSATLLTALLALSAIFVVVATTLSIAAAVFYNVVARVLGGLDVTLHDELGALPVREPQQSLAVRTDDHAV